MLSSGPSTVARPFAASSPADIALPSRADSIRAIRMQRPNRSALWRTGNPRPSLLAQFAAARRWMHPDAPSKEVEIPMADVTALTAARSGR